MRECIPVENEREWSSEPMEDPHWQSGVDLTELYAILYNEKRAKITAIKKRRVRWGLHPLGRKLIDKL